MTEQPLPGDNNAHPAETSRWSGAQFVKNLQIGTKLAIGFGILVALTFLSAGVSYLGSDRATTQIDRTGDVRVPTALVAARAQANLLRMQGDVRGYLALGDKEYRDSYDRFNQAFKADLAELDRLLTLYPDPENHRRLEELKVAYEQWAGLPARLFELRDDQLEREPAYRILATDGVQYAGRVLIDVNSMIEEEGQQPQPTAENLERLEDMAKFQGNFAAMLSALRGYITTRNRIFRQEYEVNLTANQISWDRLRGKRHTLTTTQQALLDNIEKNRASFLDLPDQMFAVLESERWREDLYLFRTEALPLAEEMRQLLSKMTDDQQTLLATDLAIGRQDLANANRLILAGGVIAFVIGVVMAYAVRTIIAAPIRRLTGVAEQIRAGDLEAQARVESKDEIGILAETFNNMTNKLRQTLMQVRKEKKRADDLLEVVIPIGVELASEEDFNRLLEKMLLEAKAFCHARGGNLYLRTEDEQLAFVIVRNDVQGIALGGTTGREISFTPIPLYDKETGAPNDRNLAARVVHQGTSINTLNPAEAEDASPSDTLISTEAYATSLLAIPLKNSEGHVLGVLQLMDAQDPETGTIIPFDQNLQQMMESFSSLAVAALEAYIREQKLRQEIQKLRIEIDEVRSRKQVSEIVETDFFQDLKERAEAMRRRRTEGRTEGRKKKRAEPDKSTA